MRIVTTICLKTIHLISFHHLYICSVCYYLHLVNLNGDAKYVEKSQVNKGRPDYMFDLYTCIKIPNIFFFFFFSKIKLYFQINMWSRDQVYSRSVEVGKGAEEKLQITGEGDTNTPPHPPQTQLYMLLNNTIVHKFAL